MSESFCKYMTFIVGFFQLAFVIFDGTKSLLDEQGNVWKGRKKDGLYGHCQAAKNLLHLNHRIILV